MVIPPQPRPLYGFIGGLRAAVWLTIRSVAALSNNRSFSASILDVGVGHSGQGYTLTLLLPHVSTALSLMGAYCKKERALGRMEESSGSRGGESVAKYVGYKISKVRWKPQPSSAIQPSKIFATGSWDDEVCVN